MNEFGSITSEVSEDFETLSKPADQQSDPVNQPNPSKPAKRLNLADQRSDLTQQTSKVTEFSEATEYDQMQANLETTGPETLTQDERKLSLILGVAAVAFLASFFR